ncbi:hypothetical protein UlMin_014947 [Ulmus minor]
MALKKDVVPFAAMAAVESAIVGINTLFKAASLKGLGDFAFITYSHALGFLLLLPFTTFFFRRRERPSFKLSVLCMIVLHAMIGILARIAGFKGLEYSSPALSSTISTLSAAFTFLLAIIFRMEYVDIRRSSAQAKIIGTVVSVSGALVAVLYKGPVLVPSPSHISLHHPLKTPQPNWILGGILLALDQLLTSATYILQKQILQIYPAKLIVVVIYLLLVALLAAPLCYITENSSAWILRPDITLVAVIYSGFFGPSFMQSIHAFCLQLKGPLYISIFKPFSIVIASATSLIFLGEALHLGRYIYVIIGTSNMKYFALLLILPFFFFFFFLKSVVGAVILLLGFYAVLWGKAKEEKDKECGSDNLLGALPNGNTPLLQSYHVENNRNECK